MSVNVLRAEVLPDDRLVVTGTIEGITDEAGELVELTATGWHSALTNYLPAGPDGQPAEGAEPRQATPAEARAYCEALLLAAVPPPVVTVPVDLGP